MSTITKLVTEIVEVTVGPLGRQVALSRAQAFTEVRWTAALPAERQLHARFEAPAPIITAQLRGGDIVRVKGGSVDLYVVDSANNFRWLAILDGDQLSVLAPTSTIWQVPLVLVGVSGGVRDEQPAPPLTDLARLRRLIIEEAEGWCGPDIAAVVAESAVRRAVLEASAARPTRRLKTGIAEAIARGRADEQIVEQTSALAPAPHTAPITESHEGAIHD